MQKPLIFIVLAVGLVAIAILSARSRPEVAGSAREVAATSPLPAVLPAPVPASSAEDRLAVPRRRALTGAARVTGPRRELPVVSTHAQFAHHSGGEILRALGMEHPPQPGKVKLQDGAYEILPDVYALPINAFRESTDTKEIDRNGTFVYFRVGGERSVPVGALPVVMQTNNQTLATVTGAVVVKSKSAGAVAAVGSDFRLSTVQIFDHLNMGVFQTGRTARNELYALLDQLRRDARVAEAELEIQGDLVVPQ